MRVPAVLALALGSCTAVREAALAPDATHLIWLDHPAEHFTSALPLGNGTMGALVFGGVERERIVLNEDGLWSGSVEDPNRHDSHEYLPEIRRLLLEGKNPEAEALLSEHFTCAGAGSGQGNGADVPYGCYQVLGNLQLDFGQGPAAADYRNELDLRTGVVRTSYARGGVRFERECFVSHAHQVLVERLRCDSPGTLDFRIALDRPGSAPAECELVGGQPSLLLRGRLPSVDYAARVFVELHGGRAACETGALRIEGADEVVLRVASSTSRRGTALALANGKLALAGTVPWSELLRAHLADHHALYDRCALELKSPAEVLSIPTDKRLERLARGGEDPALAALDFHFGRYLLMSSSRPGGLPANLQGLWAEETQTPWNGDYHLDINVQMNYWPAEVANLPECHEPLFDLIESLRVPGAATAKAYYDAPGWVAHVITNIWGFTAPGEDAGWGSTLSGGAWLADHLFEHYDFGRDPNFLEHVYPALKESAQFYRAILIEEPKHHWLVTAPSNSPEHGYVLPDGRVGHTCMGPTMDQELVRELFGDVIEASRVLKVDADFRAELEAARARLAPVQVGAAGDVQEWLEDWKGSEPHHRHVSHLYALYPGEEIADDARLREAAKKTLEQRGDEGTGWSLAWKISFWARLFDGQHALALWKTLMRPVVEHGIVMGHGGTYPNLFCAHPPFQIDGNFGACAGIAEMLLQSHGGVVRLLPALPKEWSEGSVRGLRARGGFEVDLRWSGGKLRRAEVRARVAGPLVLEIAGERIERQMKAGEAFEVNR